MTSRYFIGLSFPPRLPGALLQLICAFVIRIFGIFCNIILGICYDTKTLHQEASLSLWVSLDW